MEISVVESMTIPSIDDFKLIELVRQNKPLYDKYHADYRDLIKKNIIWKAISVALAVPEEICRKRFRCLRDRFNKERKVRKDSMLTDPTVPPIFRKMLFLWEFCTHRRGPPSFIKFKDENPNEAEALEKELEKQYRILRGEELSDDDLSDENSANEQSSNNLVVYISEEDKNLEHDKDKEEGVYCTYVVADNSYHENNVPIQPAQIIFVPSENRPEIKNESGTTQAANIIIMPPQNTETDDSNEQSNNQVQSSDKQKSIEENGTYEQSNNIDNDGNFVSENIIISDLKTDKTPSLNKISNRIFSGKIGNPLKRKRMSHKLKNNTVEAEKNSKLGAGSLPTKKVIAGTAKSEPTFKPSCNDAFCAIVKSYLDKIANPERLSSARLQILTILHNEVYSTYC